MKMIFSAALCSSVVALVVLWECTCPILPKKNVEKSTKAGRF
jgi:hypothetical protein